MGEILCCVAVQGAYRVSVENAALIRRAGIDCAELHLAEPNFAYHDREVVRGAAAAFAESAVQCRSVHLDFGSDYDVSSLDDGPRRSTLEDMLHAVSVAPLLGADVAVIHGSDEPVEDGQRARRIDALRRSLEELCRAAAEQDVRLALELLPRSCLANTTAEALAVAEGLPAGQMGFCLDTNHVNLREDLAQAVKALGKRILSFHVSDNDGVDERHWFPFDGVIDWQPFMEAVRGIGFSGQFVFETGGSLKGDIPSYLSEIRRRFDRLMAL